MELQMALNVMHRLRLLLNSSLKIKGRNLVSCYIFLFQLLCDTHFVKRWGKHQEESWWRKERRKSSSHCSNPPTTDWALKRYRSLEERDGTMESQSISLNLPLNLSMQCLLVCLNSIPLLSLLKVTLVRKPHVFTKGKLLFLAKECPLFSFHLGGMHILQSFNAFFCAYHTFIYLLLCLMDAVI